MNRENFERAIEHLKEVDFKWFTMERYREAGDFKDIKCSLKGCVIGWCIELEQGNVRRLFNEQIDFTSWAMSFFEIGEAWGYEWNWCFGTDWFHFDNSLDSAIKRMEYFVDFGIPMDWHGNFWDFVNFNYERD